MQWLYVLFGVSLFIKMCAKIMFFFVNFQIFSQISPIPARYLCILVIFTVFLMFTF